MPADDTIQRPASSYPSPTSVPNATLKPLSPSLANNVWTIRGAFPISPSVSLLSTMTIYRPSSSTSLVIFNAFRASQELEKQILALGPIGHVVKLGNFHGDADAYYSTAPHLGNPKLWTLPGGSVAEGTVADAILGANLPVQDAKIVPFPGHPSPEAAIIVPCAEGKVLIACDALMYVQGAYVDYAAMEAMAKSMGLPKFVSEVGVPRPAPLWAKNTVEALGEAKVREWYQGVAAMEWNMFIGAHGDACIAPSHSGMLGAVEEVFEHFRSAK